MREKILVLTPGDPDGIGPEITWKAIQAGKFKKKKIRILCIGAREPFERLGANIVEWDLTQKHKIPPASRAPYVWLVPAPTEAPGKLFLPGYQAGWSIEKAVSLVQKKIASALVTGPIHKERLQKGGYPYPGHTEFLAKLCGAREVTMMLANETLRVSLVTTHLALKNVSQAITRTRIRKCVLQTAENLKTWWGIRKPRIAVCALNPHAGESGLFGTEEIRIISPEIHYLKNRHSRQFELDGPFPADTVFAKHIHASYHNRFDAVICMYHDQGLIPVKLLDFYRTVNVTLGLPIIRTSVDHGVGFDIANKGLADPSSLCAALELASQLIEKKRR